ncbi:MAG: HEAT repeat domain-containing protein, partial [Anaerolineae bacterium]|nr:HEAT repeat domain-containing protein [Anaerolineae bacterium]
KGMSDFDDLLAGLDENETESDETDLDTKRQAAFEARVDTYIRAAMSPKLAKNKRLKAIEFLGESGEPKAIPTLVRIYNNDKDPKVRQAAEYSLGMFRALDDALDGPQA